MERLDHFMARANAAYYADRDPFADFTTAPEISQVFGELLGAWAAVVWEMIGRPNPVLLVECGPGRGTLMRDARRLFVRVAPEFHAAHQLHLVESSARLRAAQADLLPNATWHDHWADLPPGPMILIANEFLDALPIRQFKREEAGWMERFVQDGAFVDCPSDFDCPGSVGDVREINELACVFAADLGARIAAQGGAALLLDYGPAESGPGDSLQALRQGQPADPLIEPGSADLTAHVDFQAVAQAARAAGADARGPVPQGAFLTRLGLFPRSHALARGKPPRQAMNLIDAASRLAEPDRMGRLFKALALCQFAAPVLPGFEP